MRSSRAGLFVLSLGLVAQAFAPLVLGSGVETEKMQDLTPASASVLVCPGKNLKLSSETYRIS
jgi:hypothetical protein